MSEKAPERIWVKPFHNGAVGECWHDATTEPYRTWEYNEYTRTDLAQAQLQAAVEAERKACAGVAHEKHVVMEQIGQGHPENSDSRSRCFSRAREAENIAEAIRARGNTDALEAAKAEARAEGYEAGVREAIPVAAVLTSAISLLEAGGKRAAPSDNMFEYMLADCQKVLDDFRALTPENGEDG